MPVAWLAAGLAGVSLGYLAVPGGDLARLAVGHAALSVGPLAAVVACAVAARRVPAGGRRPWVLFAAGGASAFAGQLLWAVQQLGLEREIAFPSMPFFLFLLFHPLFATGAALALRPARIRGAGVDVVLDGALVLCAAVVLTERFVLVPLPAGAGFTTLQLVSIFAGQVGSIVSVLFAGLLVVRGASILPVRSVPAIVGAAMVFFLGNGLIAAGVDPNPNGPGDAFDLVWLVGWALVAGAGVMAAQGEARAGVGGVPDGLPRQMRRAVVPGAALILGIVAMDAALQARASLAIGVTCGVLGALLATRIAHGLRTVERQAEDRRQLVQTQALVEVSRALAGATELDRTLELVSRWACKLLGAETAGIELLVDEGGTLEMRAAYGQPAHVLGMRFPVEGSFTGWVVRHGRPRATVDASADPFMRPESIAILGATPTAAAPLHFGERRLGALFATRRDRPFGASDLELLGALADQAALAIENAQLFEQVRTLSLTDPLTGLANRRQLERDLAREFAAARRGRKLVAVLFDLDGFKDYNDRHGHLAGDEALRAFGRVLAIETRAMNLAARYGGDEFLVLVTDSDPAGAQVFVQRVADHFQEEVAKLGRSRLTVSAGLAEFRPEMRSVEELFAAADRALYQVKGVRSTRSRT